MKQKLQKDEYSKGAKWWDESVGILGRDHQKRDIDPVMLSLAGSVSKKNILEIGTGNGYFAEMLAQKGAKVTAIDLSSKLIAIAKKRQQKTSARVNYLVRDAASLKGIKARSFDVVFDNMCLMDNADCKKAVRECGKVLKPQGTFIFSIMHPAFFDYGQLWTRAKIKDKEFLARVIPQYISSAPMKRPFHNSFSVTQFHRPIFEYVGYLRDAGFFIEDLREISTREMPRIARPDDGDVTLSRSKYLNVADQRIKETATKEIPFFLIIKAIKP
jgi:2-polyprenyl-3-methyl-5-hydroxy-6-metoxy-1,4-benzoquinol methylase